MHIHVCASMYVHPDACVTYVNISIFMNDKGIRLQRLSSIQKKGVGSSNILQQIL